MLARLNNRSGPVPCQFRPLDKQYRTLRRSCKRERQAEVLDTWFRHMTFYCTSHIHTWLNHVPALPLVALVCKIFAKSSIQGCKRKNMKTGNGDAKHCSFPWVLYPMSGTTQLDASNQDWRGPKATPSARFLVTARTKSEVWHYLYCACAVKFSAPFHVLLMKIYASCMCFCACSLGYWTLRRSCKRELQAEVLARDLATYVYATCNRKSCA